MKLCENLTRFHQQRDKWNKVDQISVNEPGTVTESTVSKRLFSFEIQKTHTYTSMIIVPGW